MKYQLFFCVFLIAEISFGQVELNADGIGDTYNLITSVLAPGNNPIETPDCGHVEFGEHIDEVFDSELNKAVFRFYIHASSDNDRCKNFDRQRNEIKTYDKSPENLKGVDGETVVYKWKFKLATGFQSSPNFTHLHQLKSVGGSLASMPMYTLTTRKGTPDQLELRYAETDKQITLVKKDIAPFIGTWLELTETIKYGFSGAYEIEIKNSSSGTVLLSYAVNEIINWREGAEFVRPKWGIYRSLINSQDLRDETLLFADFSIEEIDLLSVPNSETTTFTMGPNPVQDILYLSDIPRKTRLLQVFSLDGREVLNTLINATENATIDVSSLEDSVYILSLVGEKMHQSKLLVVSKK